jgi:hypothetical protein
VTGSLDDLYLTFLYSRVGNIQQKNPRKTYWSLLRQLYSKEFVWVVPNDDNRCEDGKDLRMDFVRATGVSPDNAWMEMGCSMLEMMIALSNRLAFEAEGAPEEWFWELMENMNLSECTDKNYNAPLEKYVDNRLEELQWRQYQHDGVGGLFPLNHPDRDQREVEIWYQLCAYLLERE